MNVGVAIITDEVSQPNFRLKRVVLHCRAPRLVSIDDNVCLIEAYIDITPRECTGTEIGAG
jgi:hypothetical protein